MQLTDVIADGDWRLLFTNYEELKRVTPEDVTRVAKTYFKDSNRTVGTFIPEARRRTRTDGPDAPAIDTLLTTYKPDIKVETGEALDPVSGEHREADQALDAAGRLAAGAAAERHARQSRAGDADAALRRRDVARRPERGRAADRLAPDARHQHQVAAAAAGRDAEAERHDQRRRRRSRQRQREHLDHRRESDSGPAAGGGDSARAGVSRSRLRSDSQAADRADRSQPHRAGHAGLTDAAEPPQPLSANRRAARAHHRRGDRGSEQGHAGRREAVPPDSSTARRRASSWWSASSISPQLADGGGGAARVVEERQPVPAHRQQLPGGVAHQHEDRDAGQGERPVLGRPAPPDARHRSGLSRRWCMANYMFGGGITARLPDRVRNREGYSYSVSSELHRAGRRRRGGLLRVGDLQSRRTRRRSRPASSTS